MSNIELVIKIPEEIYKASQIIDVKYEDVIQIPLEVIAKGTILPKGHGDLKDMDNIHDVLGGWDEDTSWIVDAIDYQTPTIIEADTESENRE